MQKQFSFLFRVALTSVMLLSFTLGLSQERIEYQQPSENLISFVTTNLPPKVTINKKNNAVIFAYSNRFFSIEEMQQRGLPFAGSRVIAENNSLARQVYANKLTIKPIDGSVEREVSGLPNNPQIANMKTSSTGEYIAFTNTTPNSVELWLLNVAGASAKKLIDLPLNAVFKDPYQWLRGGESLLVKVVPSAREPLQNYQSQIPTGPIIAENFGAKVITKTPQNLLENRVDEHNFEQLAQSELYIVNVDGSYKKFMDAQMFTDISISPDQNYYLVTTVERPFSYFLTMRYFPHKYTVYDTLGREVRTIYRSTLKEFQKDTTDREEYRRAISWRSDKSATLFYVTSVNKKKGEKGFINRLNLLDAPFNGKPYTIAKTKMPFQKIYWRSDKVAIYVEQSRLKPKRERIYLFNPSDEHQVPTLIKERYAKDLYEDPGRLVTALNGNGKSILRVRDNSIFFIGDGFSDKGQFPFVDKYNLARGKWERIYQGSESNRSEMIRSISNIENNEITITLESQKEYPNYYYKNIATGELRPITNFENPHPQISALHRELIRYKRSDGVELSGTLLLPADYNFKKREKLPLLLWAYPREYESAEMAGQIRISENSYFVPTATSFPIWATKGYAILHLANFPIIGEGKTEPNDSYREQLLMNAKAAIDAVNALGYIDPSRVGVGGHSYGAFMTANLLTHSSLFACGVALSGAFNRTLTPYGFQNESRSYWKATDIYNEMSPFNFAEKMNTPLLLVHGEEDENTGTYTIQTYRYYQALKGQGANVRMIILPREKHGYKGVENILHLLWEEERFFEKHLKGVEENGRRGR